MTDYQINYRISKNATIALICLFLIFLAGVVIKILSVRIKPDVFDIAFLILFIIFFVFCSAAVLAFIFNKKHILSISSKYISVAVPYFFEIAHIPLASIKEVKMSVWARSEIIFQDAGNLRKFSFMSMLLSAEDRESFLANIFDLLPNAQVK